MRRLGLLLLAACAAPAHFAGDAGCEVGGGAPREDVKRAHLACQQARGRFRELFGRTAPAGSIMLSPSQLSVSGGVENGRWQVEWPTTERLLETARLLGYARPQGDSFVAERWRAVLPHEIGHFLISADFFPQGLRGAEPARYATLLPDWFDEAVAIWVEPQASREERLAMSRRLTTGWPSLLDLVEREHPAALAPEWHAASRVQTHIRTVTAGPCRGVCLGRKNPDGVDTLRADTMRVAYLIDADGKSTVVEGRAALRKAIQAERAAEFSAAAFRLLLFLRERGGPSSIQEIIRRLRLDPRYPDLLLGLPGLPSEKAALEAEWRGWLVNPTSRAGTRRPGGRRGRARPAGPGQ